MSFMFKPLAYDDMRAVNRIKLPEGLCQRVLEDCGDIAAHILHAGGLPGKKTVIGVDGYIGAQFGALLDAIETCASAMGLSFRSVDMRRIYKTKEEIDRLTAKNLPEDREEDPVLLFGRLYKGTIDDFLDQEKAAALLKEPSQDVTVVYGHGSCAASMRPYLDRLAYIDVTPKVTVIRAREGKVVNIGDTIPRPFPLLMRRGYFVDFEVEVKLRRELLQQDLLDFYLLGNEEGRYQMMGAQDLEQIVDRLVKYPFRAKPVYLEGIWGGEFIRKARRLPKDIAENIAWIFEFIPMEVSIVVDLGEKLVDIPFSTFVQKKGVEMMGQHCVDEFDGYLKKNSRIGGEPCMRDIPGIEATTGSLGHGLSMGIGMALGQKLNGYHAKTFVLLGDGECQEGTVWEALLLAPAFHLNNLVVILDANQIQKMDTIENIIGISNWRKRIEPLGWNVKEVDGHDVDAIVSCLKEDNLHENPVFIIAHTVKGKGVSIMEGNPIWHFKLPNRKEKKIFMQELDITEGEMTV